MEGSTLLAYKRASSIYANPSPEDVLEIGDILIAAGDENNLAQQIRKLKR